MPSEPPARRSWARTLPLLLLTTVVALVLVLLPDAFDLVRRGGSVGSLLELLRDPAPEAALNAISNAAEVVSAVFGIAITVVAIVVELAANRYTHRITELFLKDRINGAVMGFFVVSGIVSLTVVLLFDPGGMRVEGGFVPHFGVTMATGMLAASMLVLLPYFAHVFEFLTPTNVLRRMRQDALRAIARGRDVAAMHREALRGIEQTADVGLNAIEHKDKGIAMAAVRSLAELLEAYRGMREQLPEAWFRMDGLLVENPDFVSMSPEALQTLSKRRIWFETKVLREYQTLYAEALGRIRDVAYLIAIHTRHLAEEALRHGDDHVFEVAVKFFNTYIRATLNARDVRTAYNVFNQYRLLAEQALERGDGQPAVEIARYFKYYGLLAYQAELPFVLETVAYDLAALCERAHARRSPAARSLLRIFLEVDREGEGEVQEKSLRGVRKAQLKLATYYLLHDDEPLARLVFEDMRNERRERLASIRDELMAVQSPEFWEVSDRGVNFDYLPPERKEQLERFFSWFGETLPPPRPTLTPMTPAVRPTPPTTPPAAGQRTEPG